MKLSKFKVSRFGIEKSPTLVDRISCFFGYHQIVKERKVSCQTDKVRCVKCGREFAINHTMRTVIRWDKDVETFYRENSETFKP